MHVPDPPTGRSHRYALASTLLAVLGICLALLAVVLPPDPEDCEDPASTCSVYGVGEQRARESQIERVGGRALVLAVRFQTWAATWLEGRRLVMLLAVVALLCAALLRRIAGALRDEERVAVAEADAAIARARARLDEDTGGASPP